MAFFDDLSRKLTSVSQTAVQKTKDVADIAKINSEISDLQRTANNLYYEIGKLYVAKHAASCESDFVGMIGSVLDAENKISERRQRIQDIKGVIRCEKCGAELPSGAAFCSSCGASIPKNTVAVDHTDMEKCANCGAMVQKGMRFCTVCGKPMNQQMPSQNEDQDENEVEAAERTCPNCGAKIENNETFCTECGAKL